MTHFIMAAMISMFGFGAIANDGSNYHGEYDRAYGDCPDHRGGHDDTPTVRDNHGTWVCYADNLIVKGFIGVSSDRNTAMAIAMARCDSNSQLPCFPSLCRQE